MFMKLNQFQIWTHDKLYKIYSQENYFSTQIRFVYFFTCDKLVNPAQHLLVFFTKNKLPQKEKQPHASVPAKLPELNVYDNFLPQTLEAASILNA